MATAGKQVDADLATTMGRVYAVRRTWGEPIDTSSVPERHWLELALLPRSHRALGCFPERWGPHRFQAIGELFLFPAAEPVRARSECRSQSSIVCALRPEELSEWLEGDLVWTEGRLSGCLDIANATIRQLLFRLGEELRSPGFAAATMIELIVGQAAIELGRHFGAIGDGRAAGGLAAWRLRLIDERLAETDAPPSLAELATLCGLSSRQLARGFRASRNCSIGAYVARSRIERAKLMLASDQGAKAVARSLGFSSPSHLSTAFRRATGETPLAFQARARRPAGARRPH